MVQIEEEDEEVPDKTQRKVDQDGWEHLLEGKVRKRVLKEGSGKRPELKQDVRCSIEVRLAGEGSDSEVLLRYPDVRYRTGEGEAAPMLELAFRYMEEDEEAEVVGDASMAWGASGLKAISADEKGVPPDSDISMRVQLLEVLDVKYTDETTAPWNELIQMVTWRKQNGNDHFKRQDYEKALKCYTAGFEVFQHQGVEPPDQVKNKAAAKAAAMSVVTDCGANLAAVQLELNCPGKAKQIAMQALDMYPKHLKCLYRAAKACMLLDEFDECEKLLVRGYKVDDENAALQKVEMELARKKKAYEMKSKKVAGKVFKDVFKELDYPDLVADRAKQEAEWEEEETWRFWFRENVLPWFSLKILGVIVAGIIVLLLLLAVLPRTRWPLAFAGVILCVPMTIGIIQARDEVDDKKSKTKKKKA